MNWLDYYFYRFYKTILKIEGYDTNYINAYIGIAAMLFLNFLSVVFWFEFQDIVDVYWSFLVLFLLVFLSYMYFIRKNRYLQIIDKYSKHDPYPKLGKIITLSYFLITLIVFIMAVKAVRDKNLGLIGLVY